MKYGPSLLASLLAKILLRLRFDFHISLIEISPDRDNDHGAYHASEKSDPFHSASLASPVGTAITRRPTPPTKLAVG